jgi:phosphoserine phosphatase
MLMNNVKVKEGAKLVVFDLDSAFLKERFIDVCARQFNFYQALTLLRQIDKDAVSLSRRTASFLTGKNIHQLYDIASGIPMIDELDVVVEELKERGCIIGIMSESYRQVVEFIGKKIKPDFCLGYELNMQGDYITGELLIPPYLLHTDKSSCWHRSCKTNGLRFVCEKYSIPLEHTIVVGDLENEACLLRHAGMHVSISTCNGLYSEVAKRQLAEKSLRELLTYTS